MVALTIVFLLMIQGFILALWYCCCLRRLDDSNEKRMPDRSAMENRKRNQDQYIGKKRGMGRKRSPSIENSANLTSIQKTIRFEGRKLGMTSTNWKAGIVYRALEGGQAQKLGVKKGWKILKVDGKPYSKWAIDDCIEKGQSFSITFETDKVQKEKPCRSSTASHSTISTTEMREANSGDAPEVNPGLMISKADMKLHISITAASRSSENTDSSISPLSMDPQAADLAHTQRISTSSFDRTRNSTSSLPPFHPSYRMSTSEKHEPSSPFFLLHE